MVLSLKVATESVTLGLYFDIAKLSPDFKKSKSILLPVKSAANASSTI